MSKVDALRALREAKFAAQPAAVRAVPAPASRPVSRPVPQAPVATRTKPVALVESAAGTDSCGHRSMNGRTCTREQGHAEKNHRYG